MPADTRPCPSCGYQIERIWNHCPVCGRPVASAAPSPPAIRPAHVAPEFESVDDDAKKDMSLTGPALMLLGVLGFIGVVAYIVNAKGRLNLQALLVVGGGFILCVIVGSAVARARATPAASTGSAIAGGCLSAIMGGVLTVLLAFAAIAYAIGDCLDACGGKPPR
jgi:hypothetical protein